MKRYIIILLAAGLLAACSRGNPEITSEELYSHIAYLASDRLAGRMTGTEGDSLAAVYIRNELLSYGLAPFTDDGFQRFRVTSSLSAGDGNLMIIDGVEMTEGSDFTPSSVTENAEIEASVAFAGYGLRIDTDTLKWDDYAGLEVAGKWVMVLRAEPEINGSGAGFAAVSSDRNKAMIAKDMGAAGVLLVSGIKYDPEDEFEPLSRADYPVGIPVIRIKREIATLLLSETGASIEEKEDIIDRLQKPAGINTGKTVRAVTEVKRETAGTRNVVMVLPGNDPVLKDEFLVLGAHYDHLGYGGEGSSSRIPDTVAVHYGADDNASGIALMLELAEKFASEPQTNARSIVFIAFSAEEMGLLGARHFIDNIPVSPASVNAMINLDMIGRLKESRVLQVGGAGTAAGMRELLTKFNDTTSLKLALSDEGYGPSDHSIFYGADIPVIFVSTGPHLDYHTPLDTKDRINYDGMTAIADFIYSVADNLAGTSEKLTFMEAGPRHGGNHGNRRGGITLGIMPDFSGIIKDGLRADFVTPGRPAALGGMQRGDIIKSVNGKPVNNIEDYMYRLNQLKQGETITVEILRGEEKELLIIQL
ncbi:MAG: M20/M25/M40 family metallo-hydrolase [Bacteroidales bacterium]